MTETTNATETLDQALGRVWQHNWQHKRSGATLKSQAEIAVYTLKRLATGTSGLHPREYVGVTARDITQFHVQQATADWYDTGISPATIQKRLSCLSVLGVSVEGCRVKKPKQLKWHLKESDKPKVLAWLRDGPLDEVVSFHHPVATVADFIEWTTIVGTRVEEALALTRESFNEDFTEVCVPGLKTAASQATLPLGAAATTIAKRRFSSSFMAQAAGEDLRAFPVGYEDLHGVWDAVRSVFGWQDDSTATLKALRRSAARYLHVDCGMPLHMVQQYLRHESMDTTLEYLRLTGGYGTEEMRRYLR